MQNTNKIIKSFIIFSTAVLFLAGCSGIKTYRNSSPENVHITTSAKEDWLMYRLSVELNIYSVSDRCAREYEGTRVINEPKNDIALPTDKLSYLEFIYVKYPVLGGTRYITKHGTLFRARPGMTYGIDVNYNSGIYDVYITEQNPVNGKTSPVPFVSMARCHQSLM